MISTFYKTKSMKRILTYGLVGVLAFLAEYFSFIFLLNITITPHALVLAQSVSFSFGLIISFTGSRLFTFNDINSTYSHSVSRQISSYLTLAFINLVLSNLVIYAIVHYFSVTPFIAKLLVMSMVVVWNFLIFQKIIFKSK